MTIKDIDKMFSDDDKKIDSMSLKEKYEYFKKFGYFPNVEFSKELLDNGIIDEYTHNVYVDLNNKVGKGTSSKNGTLSISVKSDEELDSIRTVVKSVSEKINSLDPKKDATKLHLLHDIVNQLNAYLNVIFSDEKTVDATDKGSQRTQSKDVE